MALPVAIVGSPGTGRTRAARYLHRASSACPAPIRAAYWAASVDLAVCGEIARHGKAGRRRRHGRNHPDRHAAEQILPEIQPHPARAIRGGDGLVGGPRVLALLCHDPSASFWTATPVVQSSEKAPRPRY